MKKGVILGLIIGMLFMLNPLINASICASGQEVTVYCDSFTSQNSQQNQVQVQQQVQTQSLTEDQVYSFKTMGIIISVIALFGITGLSYFIIKKVRKKL